MKQERTCPKCGGSVRYYHAASPDLVTRVVCKGDCPEWTIIETIDRSVKKIQSNKENEVFAFKKT